MAEERFLDTTPPDEPTITLPDIGKRKTKREGSPYRLGKFTDTKFPDQITRTGEYTELVDKLAYIRLKNKDSREIFDDSVKVITTLKVPGTSNYKKAVYAEYLAMLQEPKAERERKYGHIDEDANYTEELYRRITENYSKSYYAAEKPELEVILKPPPIVDTLIRAGTASIHNFVTSVISDIIDIANINISTYSSEIDAIDPKIFDRNSYNLDRSKVIINPSIDGRKRRAVMLRQEVDRRFKEIYDGALFRIVKQLISNKFPYKLDSSEVTKIAHSIPKTRSFLAISAHIDKYLAYKEYSDKSLYSKNEVDSYQRLYSSIIDVLGPIDNLLKVNDLLKPSSPYVVSMTPGTELSDDAINQIHDILESDAKAVTTKFEDTLSKKQKVFLRKKLAFGMSEAPYSANPNHALEKAVGSYIPEPVVDTKREQLSHMIQMYIEHLDADNKDANKIAIKAVRDYIASKGYAVPEKHRVIFDPEVTPNSMPDTNVISDMIAPKLAEVLLGFEKPIHVPVDTINSKIAKLVIKFNNENASSYMAAPFFISKADYPDGVLCTPLSGITTTNDLDTGTRSAIDNFMEVFLKNVKENTTYTVADIAIRTLENTVLNHQQGDKSNRSIDEQQLEALDIYIGKALYKASNKNSTNVSVRALVINSANMLLNYPRLLKYKELLFVKEVLATLTKGNPLESALAANYERRLPFTVIKDLLSGTLHAHNPGETASDTMHYRLRNAYGEMQELDTRSGILNSIDLPLGKNGKVLTVCVFNPHARHINMSQLSGSKYPVVSIYHPKIRKYLINSYIDDTPDTSTEIIRPNETTGIMEVRNSPSSVTFSVPVNGRAQNFTTDDIAEAFDPLTDSILQKHGFSSGNPRLDDAMLELLNEKVAMMAILYSDNEHAEDVHKYIVDEYGPLTAKDGKIKQSKHTPLKIVTEGYMDTLDDFFTVKKLIDVFLKAASLAHSEYKTNTSAGLSDTNSDLFELKYPEFTTLRAMLETKVKSTDIVIGRTRQLADRKFDSKKYKENPDDDDWRSILAPLWSYTSQPKRMGIEQRVIRRDADDNATHNQSQQPGILFTLTSAQFKDKDTAYSWYDSIFTDIPRVIGSNTYYKDNILPGYHSEFIDSHKDDKIAIVIRTKNAPIYNNIITLQVWLGKEDDEVYRENKKEYAAHMRSVRLSKLKDMIAPELSEEEKEELQTVKGLNKAVASMYGLQYKQTAASHVLGEAKAPNAAKEAQVQDTKIRTTTTNTPDTASSDTPHIPKKRKRIIRSAAEYKPTGDTP